MEQSNFLKNNWKYTFYNSQTLTTKDIKESLLGKTWLNDNIITFFYLFLIGSMILWRFLFTDATNLGFIPPTKLQIDNDRIYSTII